MILTETEAEKLLDVAARRVDPDAPVDREDVEFLIDVVVVNYINAIDRVENLVDNWNTIYGPGSRGEEVYGPQRISVEHIHTSITRAIDNELTGGLI